MLTRFEARGFRNLEPMALEFSSGAHLFLGDNGAGKTSLLEAVYLLATTRSFRTSRIQECVRHEGDGAFFLRGETDDRAQLEVGWVEGDRIRKTRGSRASLAEHLAVLPVVSWTQTDIDVLIGPPEARRRFLDRGVVGRRPSAIAVITRYRRALQEKRKLLQRGTVRRDELDPWNLVLAAASAEMSELRRAHVEALGRELEEILRLCELDLPPISLRYRPSPKEALEGAEAVFDKLSSVAERETLLQQPLLGCHRDELEIRWQGHPIRRVASAGERKALGLTITAAHGRVIESAAARPVYLLDDVDTELDAGRLAALWRYFGAVDQVLVTSNRPAVWQNLEGLRRFRCALGSIREIP